ncbi:hypothetical protein QTG56_24650 (plasmid) [Rossellomorea sp. AcN35-11]|nr:hypothetical protein [Rossellomorea aquimaris]WJV31826.1 hypothetical protein QTG56_24650 [Rossellomorea sp. AcN35-11]
MINLHVETDTPQPKLSKDEEKTLLDYLGPRVKNTKFYDLIKGFECEHDIAYRGSAYQSRHIIKGSLYEPWDVTSWSKDHNVALNFASECYVPEDLLEEIMEEEGLTVEEAFDLFVPVLFVWKNALGLDVNDILPDQVFKSEKEIITQYMNFRVEEIEELPLNNHKLHKSYFKVLVSLDRSNI